MRKIILALAAAVLFLLGGRAEAQIACPALPYTFVNGTLADAGQVNANFANVHNCITTSIAAPHTANTTTLSQQSTLTFPSGIWRDAVAVAGDAPPLYYVPNIAACPFGGGAGDGGAQVSSVNGLCWLAVFPSTGIDLLEYGPQCDGSADDKTLILAAVFAANAIGLPLSWPKKNCFSSVQIPFGAVPVHGAARLVATNPPAGPQLTCPASLAAPCAVFGTTAANGLRGGAFDNLWVSYSGSPVSGDAAFEVIGSNSTYTNVLASNAYDGFQFGNGVFGDAISAHGDHVYTWKIVHDHIVQNAAPEVFIENYRLGINGVGDVASNAFVGVTGFDPNTLSLSHGVMALGVGVPTWVIDFFGVSGQTDGIYNFSDTVIDVSVGSNSIVHSDGTGTCFRCTFSGVNVVALTSSMFSFAGGTPPMNESTFSDSNFFVNDFTFPTATYTALRVANAYVSGTFSLISASSGSGASLSNIQTAGAFTIGGAWGRLNMSGITAPSYTDTATGFVFASAVPTVPWTPVMSFGGGSTGLTYLAQVGSAARNPDGTFTAQYGVKINAIGSSTGAVLISGMPYTCLTYGLGANVVSPIYTSGVVGLTGTAIAVPIPATSHFGLSQGSSTGLPSLTDSNFATNSIVSGAVTCPAQ